MALDKPRRVLIALSLVGALTVGSAPVRAYDWGLPPWMPEPVVPADNPMTDAKVELGRYLFYDTRLSADGTVACATCHQQARAFTDGRARPVGVHGTPGVRSAMALANVAYLPVLTWANPTQRRLETQALVPLFGSHPVEMGLEGQEATLFARLRADPSYRERFARAFPETDGDVDLRTLTHALASFERSLLSFRSAYDRYRYGGDATALSASARRGEALFFGENLECSHCHGGLNLTDNVQHVRLPDSEIGFHNTGLYNLDGRGAYPPDNPGIREFTGVPADEGKFRTPSLRNVALTAPYMHDGSIATLAEVVRSHYAKQGMAARDGGAPSPLRDDLIVGFEVSDADVADVVAFLESLTDVEFTTDPRFASPFQ